MNPRERVNAALVGGPVDRPPVSFWGHVYDRENSAADLVAATLDAHAKFGWDWIKLNPRKHYHVEPWGVRYRYDGANKPVLSEWPLKRPEDWRAITKQPHDGGALGEQIEAVRMLRARLPQDVPFIQTVFTPFAILGEITETPGELRAHIDSHPDLVRGALEAVTATFVPFVKAVLAAGADGIFFATVDWASREIMDAGKYRQWARPTDLELIAAARDARFNVLHVCRGQNLLAEVADYPVAAFSWAATDPTNPSLADALKMTRAAVMGGVSHEGPLQASDPSGAVEEVKHGFEQTGGQRWLVAPGCSIPPETPDANLHAVRAAVETAGTASERST